MKRKKSKMGSIMLFLFSFMLLGAYSPIRADVLQQRTIAGNVTGVDNETIIGVTVLEKGTSNGAITDLNGNFKITVTTKNPVLEFSFIGYNKKEVSVGTKNNIKVVLEENVKALDEVVVIGYGTTTRRDLTGSIASVNISDLKKAPVVSFEDALGGRIAGVQVTTADGQPGSAPTIIIRGANSITQDNSPLYVIDGFPLEDFANNTINPEDIASIEVLKDASATAIYGARGANGVVLITTKRGMVSAPTVTYQYSFGTHKTLKKMDMMDPYEFVKYQKEYGGIIADLYQDPEFYKDKEGLDWQDLLFRTATTQSHFLSLNGGNQQTRYSISTSLLDQEGVILNSGFTRFQGRVVLDQNISSKVKVGINANYTRSKTYGQIFRNSDNASVTSYTMYSAWGARPISANGDTESIIGDLLDPDIDGSFDYRVNPIINLENVHNPTYSNVLIANAYLEIEILKGLIFKTTGGATVTNSRAERFYNSKTGAGSTLTVIGKTNGVNGSISNTESFNWLNENTLTYNTTFKKKHRFSVMGGFTAQGAERRTSGFTAIQLPNESLGISGLEEGVISKAASSQLASTLASFLGRVNYGFDGRYLLTANFRADGSSKFPAGNKWGYFPSASLGWVISEEDFMKAVPAISFAKLRGGYGLTGNNRVSEFGYLPALMLNFFSGSGNTSSAYAFNNSVHNGAAPSNLGNSDLKWETTSQLNIGLDLGFLKDRISLTVDYYKKKTYDLLLNATLAPSMGYKTAYKNIGKVSNEGVEFTLNTKNIMTRNFQWTSSFNISFNKDEVVSLNDDQPSLATAVGWNSNFSQTQPYIAVPGKPISMFYGYVWEGVYQLDDFIQLPNGTYQIKPDVPNHNNNSQPGTIKYKDLNGDGVINNLDYTIIGNPNPIHIGGFTNNFAYKDFDLSIFLQWSYGNDVLNANRYDFEGQTNRHQLNMFTSYVDRWSLENQDSKNHIVKGGGANVYSDRVIEDGSYLRLKTVSLGYNVPQKLLNRIGVESLRIYASGQNLITWTNYSGLDPEVSTRPGALTVGFDFSPYPKARTITFGANLKF